MSKRYTLALLVILAFCQCYKEPAPLRVRYHNQTNEALDNIRAALLQDNGYTPVGKLAPGAYSDWITVDQLENYCTGPAHYLEGTTPAQPFVASAFHDCLVGETPVVYTTGDLTFTIRPWDFSWWWINDGKLRYELKLEE